MKKLSVKSLNLLINRNRIIAVFFLIFLFFYNSCSTINNPVVSNPQTGSFKGEEFDLEKGLVFLEKKQFQESFTYFFYYYQERDKYPLLKEKISFYTFASLIYSLKNDFDEYARLLEITDKDDGQKTEAGISLSENLLKKDELKKKLEQADELALDIYLTYKYEFEVSKNLKEVEFFYLLYIFEKQDYPVYIYRYQNTELPGLSADKADFLLYLQAFSYLKLYNLEKSGFYGSQIINPLLHDKFMAFYQYYGLSNPFDANNYLKKFPEGSPLYVEDQLPVYYSLFDPITQETIDKIKAFNSLRFFDLPAFKDKLAYKGIYYKNYFFIGTFLHGLYVFNQKGELARYYNPYNSPLSSVYIRNFFITEDKLYVVTYEGINEISVYDGQLVLKKNPQYQGKYNFISLVENKHYLIAGTHYYGVIVYDKTKNSKFILKDKSVIESLFLDGDTLWIGTLNQGLSVYDLSIKKYITQDNKIFGEDIKFILKYYDSVIIGSYKKGVFLSDLGSITVKDTNSRVILVTPEQMDYILNGAISGENLYLCSIKEGLGIINISKKKFQRISYFKKMKITDISYSSGVFVISTYETGVYAFAGDIISQ